AYTHGYGAAVLKSHRARTAENSAAHLLPHLRPGMELLDVGSGAGTITAGLARLVGPAHVTALEVSEEAAAPHPRGARPPGARGGGGRGRRRPPPAVRRRQRRRGPRPPGAAACARAGAGARRVPPRD